MLDRKNEYSRAGIILGCNYDQFVINKIYAAINEILCSVERDLICAVIKYDTLSVYRFIHATLYAHYC